MSDARRVEIAICERHGLRYNAAEGLGCVRCRRESGTTTGSAARGPSAHPAASGGTKHQAASAPLQLLLAAVLVGGTGALFWAAHSEVVGSFSGVLSGGGMDGAFGLEGDDGGDSAAGEGGGEVTPAGAVAIGPAEQQRQIEEAMRQLQQDDQAEADASRRQAEARGDDFAAEPPHDDDGYEADDP